MTSTSHTKSTLDGLMKDVYSDEKLVNMVPDFGLLYKMIDFEKAKKIGRDYVKA